VAKWLVALLVLYPVLLGVLAWFSLGRFDAMPDGERPVGAPGSTYLVIGSDSREDLSREERDRLGTGQATGIRTDTIMLLQTPWVGPSTLVSIPRDSYVDIPGHGKNKINAAYSLGGPQLLVATVEQATGLRIDDVVMTGLGGFAGVVDAVGGVRLCPKTAIKDDKAHIDVPAGCQQMDGVTSLGYARARYSDPRGDLGRVERQREVLAAIASTTLSPSVIAVPWRAVPTAVAGGKALTVNSSSTPWSVARFVLGMRAVSGGGGLTLTVPIGGDISTPAGSALKWDTEQANRLFEAMNSGDRDTIREIAEAQAKKAKA
jgi:LCP family protein required for cell wall assembly